jgi:hypothetical protein
MPGRVAICPFPTVVGRPEIDLWSHYSQTVPTAQSKHPTSKKDSNLKYESDAGANVYLTKFNINPPTSNCHIFVCFVFRLFFEHEQKQNDNDMHLEQSALVSHTNLSRHRVAFPTFHREPCASNAELIRNPEKTQ